MPPRKKDEQLGAGVPEYFTRRFNPLRGDSDERLSEILNSASTSGFMFIQAVPAGGDAILIFEKR